MMLREEAIELLYDIQTDAVYNVLSSEKEALDMAIKALEQEPCEDTISRQEVLEQAKDYGSNTYLIPVNSVKTLPSVQPTRPVGKWIDIGDEGLVFKCSLCGDKNTIESHYCPNCGARMETETKIEKGLNYSDQDTMMPAT